MAAAAWLALLLLLLTAWRGRLQGGLLVSIALISLPWALRAAYDPSDSAGQIDGWYQILEIARSVAWLLFLTHLFEPARREPLSRRWRWTSLAPVSAGVVLAALELEMLSGWLPGLPPDLAILGHIGFAVAGLALIEQLFRRTRLRERWASKFLYLGVGLLFAYDFFLYADSLLFKRMNTALWEARGFVNAMIVPLLAVAAARNPKWSVEVFISRQMVHYSTAIFGAGFYLLAMASAGYYIREFGGTWGATLRVVFLAGTGVLLAALLASEQLRATLRVLVSKHFYHAKYDYREEWLRLAWTLSTEEQHEPPRMRAIRAVAEIVHSPGGMLWTRNGTNAFILRASWNMREPLNQREPINSPLLRFLRRRYWIIDLNQYTLMPEHYPGLVLPAWLKESLQAWLIIPLAQGEMLIGFLVLAQSSVSQSINWEDYDVLKTAGRQVAGYITLLESSEALAAARQFEAFHRLSAYVVHDLKNIAGQLALLVTNASRHKANPAFIEDAFSTVSNATERMNRLLTQLRIERTSGQVITLALAEAAQQAIAARAAYQPQPVLQIGTATPWVRVDRERLIAILEHLIQNAQEATSDQGKVEVRVNGDEQTAIVEIRDDGCGMDQRFIRERLFQPFTTTKGNAGMGIGVYESREFAVGAGGDLTVESTPGVGTAFYLWLPRVNAPVTDNAIIEDER